MKLGKIVVLAAILVIIFALFSTCSFDQGDFVFAKRDGNAYKDPSCRGNDCQIAFSFKKEDAAIIVDDENFFTFIDRDQETFLLARNAKEEEGWIWKGDFSRRQPK